MQLRNKEGTFSPLHTPGEGGFVASLVHLAVLYIRGGTNGSPDVPPLDGCLPGWGEGVTFWCHVFSFAQQYASAPCLVCKLKAKAEATYWGTFVTAPDDGSLCVSGYKHRETQKKEEAKNPKQQNTKNKSEATTTMQEKVCKNWNHRLYMNNFL